jgi:hypothetical protein
MGCAEFGFSCAKSGAGLYQHHIGKLLDLLRPAAEGVVRVWPVSRAVNSVRNNGAALLDRIDDPAAPPPSDAPSGPNPA